MIVNSCYIVISIIIKSNVYPVNKKLYYQKRKGYEELRR